MKRIHDASTPHDLATATQEVGSVQIIDRLTHFRSLFSQPGLSSIKKQQKLLVWSFNASVESRSHQFAWLFFIFGIRNEIAAISSQWFGHYYTSKASAWLCFDSGKACKSETSPSDIACIRFRIQIFFIFVIARNGAILRISFRWLRAGVLTSTSFIRVFFG